MHYVSHGTPILPDGTQAYTSQCRAARITEVGGWVTAETEEDSRAADAPRRRILHQEWDPSLVGLEVATPTGLFFHSLAGGGCAHDPGRADVPSFWVCDGRSHSGGTWHWPVAGG